MKSLLAILILWSSSALAQLPREPFPSDYKPLACAPADICRSFPREAMSLNAARLRRFSLRQEWVDAHWDEIMAAFRPLCAKTASCLAVPGNDWLYCADFMRSEFVATSERYPAGSDDREQWHVTALMFYMGLDEAVRAGSKEAQECAAKSPQGPDRKLVFWTSPEKIGPGYQGTFTVYAFDAETHVPVQSAITVEGQQLKPAPDSPYGAALSHYPFPWEVKFNAVPNADGHRELVAPKVTLRAKGYEPATFTMPVEVPKMIVAMTPAPSSLKKGRNTVTVTARDAATGEPVEARVMAGTAIVGKTNEPFVLEVARGQKHPEIWVTSLFNRYSDAVVAKGK